MLDGEMRLRGEFGRAFASYKPVMVASRVVLPLDVFRTSRKFWISLVAVGPE